MTRLEIVRRKQLKEGGDSYSDTLGNKTGKMGMVLVDP